MQEDSLVELIRKEDAGGFIERCLRWQKKPLKLYPSQAKVARRIVFGRRVRLVEIAHTRYGKTIGKAAAIGAKILLYPDDPIEVSVIGPTRHQTAKLRNLFSEIVVESPLLLEALPPRSRGGYDYMAREASRNRVVFQAGHKVQFYTAHGAGAGLMGMGGTDIIETESSLIGDDAEAKVIRMLVETPDTNLVKEGNPWHRDSHFYRDWKDPEFESVHIPWQVGVKEGRLEQAGVDEQRRKLSPMLFKVFFDADFPDDSKDALLKWEWIQAAVNREVPEDWAGAAKNGVDVGGEGEDLSVLARGRMAAGPQVVVDDLHDWHEGDPKKVARSIAALITKSDPSVVDTIGEGKSVYSWLRDWGYPVVSFKASRSAKEKKKRGRRAVGSNKREDADEDHAKNLKAKTYWDLRDLFQDGADPASTSWIKIPDHPELIADLQRMRYKVTDDGKVLVYEVGLAEGTGEELEGPGKSPDHGDAVMHLVYGRKKPRPRGRYV